MKPEVEMFRRTCLVLVPLAALSVACGSGGSTAYDPVTHVTLAVVPGYESGWSEWDDSGSSAKIEPSLMEWERVDTLKHELWHLLTRSGDHPNPDGCASAQDTFLFTDEACPVEVKQVNDADRVVTISFPEDPECAKAAASFWNEACGRECVVVVE